MYVSTVTVFFEHVTKEIFRFAENGDKNNDNDQKTQNGDNNYDSVQKSNV
jgi:hypothetical protein